VKIRTTRPKLVLTDLLMPKMDGLELLQAIRRDYPAIPVVLMTQFGDETTAVKALEAGAASYVPKARQAEYLVATIERVLEHASADQRRRQLVQCTMEHHCRYVLPNDRRLIRALVDELQEVTSGMNFANRMDRIRMGEAIEEALLNAMYHGNLEIGEAELTAARAQLDDAVLDRLIASRTVNPEIAARTILAVAHLTPEEVRIVIRDEGRGFNLQFEDTDGGTEAFEGGRHRGMTLIRSLMDEVSYNTSGNELTMRKFDPRTPATTSKPR
jgi:DNA-binding response OmpR family regulator